jgi:hypothetical protein
MILPMALFHHVTVFLISEQEKASFSEIGVVFDEVTREPRGESVNFDIGEDDPRWEKVVALNGIFGGTRRDTEGVPGAESCHGRTHNERELTANDKTRC